MTRRMFIVAGPPGAGKSTAFPVSGFGVDFFNADDRAAALNHGSYLNIPQAIRNEVNALFEGCLTVLGIASWNHIVGFHLWQVPAK